MYCDEPGCDCRRVFFYVVSSMRKDVEAVIAFGWERPEFYAEWMKDDDPKVIGDLRGPVLNFGSPQSPFAPAILELVKDVVLKDEQYVQRLQTHYWMFRHRMDSDGGSRARKKRGPTALRRIQGAISLHLKGMRADGMAPPRPRHRAVTPRRTSRQVDFYATVEVAA
jgi:hypothetical protein